MNCRIEYMYQSGVRVWLLAVSICSEENPCQNGGQCVDVATEDEVHAVGAKSHQVEVRKYYVSRCICRYGFSGELCQNGKSKPSFLHRASHLMSFDLN